MLQTLKTVKMLVMIMQMHANASILPICANSAVQRQQTNTT